jgi:Txe/YoeB family toxin of Txe-Axe toxin-antitoxin module
LQAIKAAERALASAELLPGPLDYETLVPPVQRAWVRRIPGHNLWLFYRVREDVVYLLFVTRDPPVPVA